MMAFGMGHTYRHGGHPHRVAAKQRTAGLYLVAWPPGTDYDFQPSGPGANQVRNVAGSGYNVLGAGDPIVTTDKVAGDPIVTEVTEQVILNPGNSR
jgi:hypothetical protein